MFSDLIIHLAGHLSVISKTIRNGENKSFFCGVTALQLSVVKVWLGLGLGLG